MTIAVLLLLKLLVVKEIQTSGADTVVFFEGGQKGKLRRSQKDYDYYLRLAQRSLQRKHPVGVTWTEADNIGELARADNDFTAQVVEQDRERMKVWFQGHDGTFFLRRDHPDCARISKVLDQSVKEKKRVWFVARTPLMLLEDVIIAGTG